MKTLYLSFLWHMHQPYYKDDFQNQYMLPWVFLHGIKDYYDMPWYLAPYSNIKAVFNFVPSLLIQMEDYGAGKVQDVLLELIRMNTHKMDLPQKTALLPQLFMANAKLIHPLPRYRQLYYRYKQFSAQDAAIHGFDSQDILDLKVLFLISWTGNYIRKESSLIQALLRQQEQFSEDQKNSLLDELLKRMRDIPVSYMELLQKGQIEISATPFYHPILPLLLNPSSAKEAKPDISMPSCTQAFVDDANWHVQEGIAHVQSVFGQDIAGMWPAEGSVSSAAAELFSLHGIQWIASDEDVLFQSLGKGAHARSALYKPHRIFCDNGKSLTLFCRDKSLSDLIGFTYSSMDAEKAASDFMDRLEEIYNASDFNPHVSVILDGENAWEFYPQNAAPFFHALYQKLEACTWIKTVTFKESLAHTDLSYEILPAIRAGSWIYGNFTTWMGHKEKNQAWELLAQTWQAVAEHKEHIPEQKWNQILNELRIAQGSDWFWWYGDDHFSVQADVFDRIFRSHLMNMYKLAGMSIPSQLFLPIKKTCKSGLLNPMSGYISPRIDGRQSGFFEWMGAAHFDLTYDMGSMHTDKRYLKNFFWGRDKQFLYFRLQGEIAELLGSGMILQTEINSPSAHCIQYTFTDPPASPKMDETGLECAAADYIEMQIPFTALKNPQAASINVQFKLLRKDTVVEQAPLYSSVDVDISTAFLDDWIV